MRFSSSIQVRNRPSSRSKRGRCNSSGYHVKRGIHNSRVKPKRADDSFLSKVPPEVFHDILKLLSSEDLVACSQRDEEETVHYARNCTSEFNLLFLNGCATDNAKKTWKDSVLNKIVQLTEKAQLRKPQLQRWLDKFGQGYSKTVVFLSVAIALVGPFLLKWPFIGTTVYRALGLMVAASPCALAVAPLAYATAISACAKKVSPQPTRFRVPLKWMHHAPAPAPTDSYIEELTKKIRHDLVDDMEAKLERKVNEEVDAKVNQKVQDNMVVVLKKLAEANPSLHIDLGQICATISSDTVGDGTPMTDSPSS